MRLIQNIEELDIPSKYQNHISEYLRNIANIPFVGRVILFGSCAKEMVNRYSDIDIFVTANRAITEEEEFQLMFDCLPSYSIDSISMDIVVQPESLFNKYKDTTCMLQKQVNYYGVDLSGLIC